MLGPTAAIMSCAAAPYRDVSARTASMAAPAAVPCQPAWTAATAPVTGSASRIGTQSAARTLNDNAESAVIAMSADVESGAGAGV